MLLALLNLDAIHGPSLIALLALALTCGVLSLIVLWRRWAFLGEGIAHAGFGGAGTAWLLAAFLPSLDQNWFVSLCVAAFCLLTAAGIGRLSRNPRVQADTAIGAFLVGALAWGFLGQQVYLSALGRTPAGFSALLFGHTQLLSSLHAQLALALLCITVLLLAYFRRPVLLFCLDPELAATSGVPVVRIHYLLILLVAFAIMVGVRIVGSVLITALLILPGAAAVLLTRRLGLTIIFAAAIALVASILGMLTSARWPMLPQGPMIVLILFVIFIAVWQIRRGR